MSMTKPIKDFLEANTQTVERKVVEEAIVRWRGIREDRLAFSRQADALEKIEKALKQWIISVLRDQQYEAVVIDGKATGLSPHEVAICTDRGALVEYILKHQALELLEFRLAQKAIEEYLATGREVPGVEMMEQYNLFNRKV